jgi:hypothetical protein
MDVLGGFCRLLRQRFHLRRDHREAAAGIAGARGFDGRVQCQEIGLARDRVDELDDVADSACRLRQFAEARVGASRLLDRIARHAC